MTKPGVYKHWRADRALYRVLFVAIDATLNQNPKRSVVVYMSLQTGQLFTRDEAQFHEEVRRTPPQPNAPCLCDARGQAECRQHPGDQTMVPRFVYVGDHT